MAAACSHPEGATKDHKSFAYPALHRQSTKSVVADYALQSQRAGLVPHGHHW